MPIRRGGRAKGMPASWGVRLPFLLLQGKQQATRFSHTESPPLDRGTTWSRVRLPEGSRARQYWQVLPSRSRIPFLETERCSRGIFRYLCIRTTLGIGMVSLDVRTEKADLSSTTAAPLITRVMARRLGGHFKTGQ